VTSRCWIALPPLSHSIMESARGQNGFSFFHPTVAGRGLLLCPGLSWTHRRNTEPRRYSASTSRFTCAAENSLPFAVT
jgi:hypothetical protein